MNGLMGEDPKKKKAKVAAMEKMLSPLMPVRTMKPKPKKETPKKK